MSDPGRPMKPPAKVPYKRIATEEAWITPEILKGYRELVGNKDGDAGFLSLWGVFIGRGGILLDRLLDMGENRIRDMDAAGIDVQLLLLTAPGVQVFRADKARALAASSNDRLAEAIRKYPERFAGLAAIAPQGPKTAAKELERSFRKLGLKGAVINSHTRGEYLDSPKFWEIFEAAESLKVPIYIHPQTPSPDMVRPFVKRGLDTAIMGFGVEVALHTLAIITSGALDRFPELKIVIGHGGEGLPYWLYRIDYMQEYNRQAFMPKLRMLPSDYMKRNIYITTSGLPWAPAITMAQSVLGMDRVLYAMDYPYQYRVEEVVMTDRFPIGAADKKNLFQRNAEKVFSL
ncbi:MAG: amidohydrolase [Acidobacteria bacterium]|nr:amidohydrolase [Acidobacteriota bacterium]